VPDFFDTETAKLYHAPLMAASPKNHTSSTKAKGVVINNAEFAKKALELHDIIAVSQFSRLQDVIASPEGMLDYRLVGGKGEDGQLKLELSIQGNLQLGCQRCLEPFVFELNIASRFLVVPDESAIPISEEGFESVGDDDFLVAETHMQVFDLIEDEILLALPLAPRHEPAFCNASGALDELKKPSPFAVLQGWKASKNQN
jgi:DUF177 domain-containing protein